MPFFFSLHLGFSFAATLPADTLMENVHGNANVQLISH